LSSLKKTSKYSSNLYLKSTRIRTLTNVIRTLTNVIRTLTNVIRTLTNVIRTLTNVIKTLTSVIKTLTNVIKNLTNVTINIWLQTMEEITKKFTKRANKQITEIAVHGNSNQHYVHGKILDMKHKVLQSWTSDILPVSIDDKCKQLELDNFDYKFDIKPGLRRKNITALSMSHVKQILLCDRNQILKELNKRQLTLYVMNEVEYVSKSDILIIINSLQHSKQKRYNRLRTKRKQLKKSQKPEK